MADTHRLARRRGGRRLARRSTSMPSRAGWAAARVRAPADDALRGALRRAARRAADPRAAGPPRDPGDLLRARADGGDAPARGARELLEAGHEVGHHGYLHLRTDQVARASSARRSSAGSRRSRRPARRGPSATLDSWEVTPETFALLVEAGFEYDSSCMGDDRPYFEEHGRAARSSSCPCTGRSTTGRASAGTIDSGGNITHPEELFDAWEAEYVLGPPRAPPRDLHDAPRGDRARPALPPARAAGRADGRPTATSGSRGSIRSRGGDFMTRTYRIRRRRPRASAGSSSARPPRRGAPHGRRLPAS